MLSLNHRPWWIIINTNVSFIECVDAGQVIRCLHLPWAMLTSPFLSQTRTLSVRRLKVHGFIRNLFLIWVMCPTWKTLAHTLQLGSSWKKVKIITCTAVSQMPYVLSQSAGCYRTFASPAGAMPSKLVNFGLPLSNPMLFQLLWGRQAVLCLFLPHNDPM